MPSQDWIEQVVQSYKHGNVGGVAGDVIPVNLCGDKIQVAGKSEIIPEQKYGYLARKLWCRPVEGMENYMVYLAKSGTVEYNLRAVNANRPIASLLGMGANMTVLSKAISGFRFPANSWVRGITYEQYLAWHIWKQNYKLLFNPQLKVFHIKHGETLSRSKTSFATRTLRSLEYSLLYYRLPQAKPSLSRKYRLLWIMAQAVERCKTGTFYSMARLRGTLFAEVLGLKWTLIRKCGGNYQLLRDLLRFC